MAHGLERKKDDGTTIATNEYELSVNCTNELLHPPSEGNASHNALTIRDIRVIRGSHSGFWVEGFLIRRKPPPASTSQ
jgi:hypothetical protein